VHTDAGRTKKPASTQDMASCDTQLGKLWAKYATATPRTSLSPSRPGLVLRQVGRAPRSRSRRLVSERMRASTELEDQVAQ
jgi:hypothetical protein